MYIGTVYVYLFESWLSNIDQYTTWYLPNQSWGLSITAQEVHWILINDIDSIARNASGRKLNFRRALNFTKP